MNDEIKEILDKLSNRKRKPLINCLRDCQLKNIEHPFVTKEEYIDKLLDYITNLQTENERLKDDKKKVLELIENDYFEDGSFENYDEVLKILKGEE